MLGAAASGAALLIVRPSLVGLVPPCPFHALTGLDCPLCGGSRGISAMANGDWATAADYNLLVTVAVPLVLCLAVLAVVLGPRATPVFQSLGSRTGVMVIVMVVLGFFVLRMTPFAGWLTTAA